MDVLLISSHGPIAFSERCFRSAPVGPLHLSDSCTKLRLGPSHIHRGAAYILTWAHVVFVNICWWFCLSPSLFWKVLLISSSGPITSQQQLLKASLGPIAYSWRCCWYPHMSPFYLQKHLPMALFGPVLFSATAAKSVALAYHIFWSTAHILTWAYVIRRNICWLLRLSLLHFHSGAADRLKWAHCILSNSCRKLWPIFIFLDALSVSSHGPMVHCSFWKILWWEHCIYSDSCKLKAFAWGITVTRGCCWCPHNSQLHFRRWFLKSLRSITFIRMHCHLSVKCFKLYAAPHSAPAVWLSLTTVLTRLKFGMKVLGNFGFIIININIGSPATS